MDCKKEKIILIITGCINPNPNQGWLVLKNVDERLKQYVESIIFYIENSPFKGIVFCDNSNYVCDKITYLEDLANENGKAFEWLGFKGDDKKVVQYNNKGIGEDEIMDYVCSHSRLYAEADSFVKVTGRLTLNNINSLMNNAVHGTNYFYRDIYRGKSTKGIDTRFFIVTKTFYEENIRKCYDRVSKKTCYEEAFFQLVGNDYSLLNAYPHFIGQSSGNGRDYGKTKSVYIQILDFLCRYDLFNKYFPLFLFSLRVRNKIRRMLKRINIFGGGNFIVRKLKREVSKIQSKDIFCRTTKINNYGSGKYKKYMFGKNNKIEIGRNTRLQNTFFRIVGNCNTLIFEENCIVGPGCSFWMEGDNITIKIGRGTTFTNDVHVNAQENHSTIVLGEDCMLSNHIIIRTSDSHPIYDSATGVRLNPAKPVFIGNHVWIAPNSTIMKGAVISDGVIICSNTMVSKEIDANSLAVGTPAKIVKRNVCWTRERLF